MGSLTTLEFAGGLVRLALVIGPLMFAAHVLRRRILPEAGSLAAVTEAMLFVSILVVILQVLGALSALRIVPLVAVSVLLAVALGLWTRTRPPVSAPQPPAVPSDRRAGVSLRDPAILALLFSIAIVAGAWIYETRLALRTGMTQFDTVWYHMPFAAQFAQTGSTTALQFTQPDPLPAFYPGNSELVHALGIVALHRDILSPFLNLGWAALALLAGWSIGQRWRSGPATTVAVALVLCTSVNIGSQPGTASNDIVGVAMLLAAVALVVHADRHRAMLPLAALSAGLAIGTKYSYLVPAFAIIGGAILLGPAVTRSAVSRLRTAAICGLAMAITGGFWYVRNGIATGGNPFGVLARIGPVSLPSPNSPLQRYYSETILSNLEHGYLWRTRFIPGLHDALGPDWWLILALAGIGLLAPLFARGREHVVRMLAVAGLLSVVAYTALPTSASQLQRTAGFFSGNIRYADLPLMLGLILLVVTVAPYRALRRWMAPALTLVLLGSQLTSGQLPYQPSGRFKATAIVLIAGVLLVAGLPRLRLVSRRALVGALTLTLIPVLVGAWFLQRSYFRGRYESGPGDAGLIAIDRWAATVHNARIAIDGPLLQYPLYGTDISNRVVYLGHRSAGGNFAEIRNCKEWRTALGDGRFQYVVVTPLGLTSSLTIPPGGAWTASDRAAKVVLAASPDEIVYRLRGPTDPAGCPASP